MSGEMIAGRDSIIGVDFDNTIVAYDELFHAAAVQRGLIPSTTDKKKKAIRDRIVRLPDGEIEWQKLQALAYGYWISEARLINGVREFIGYCRHNRVRVYIISHKTDFAGRGDMQVNLRTAAHKWMVAHKFFQPDGLGFSPEDVFFGATRQEKIEYIRHLGCTHFIDDLEETFHEPAFPANVKKILYAPCQPTIANQEVTVMTDWQGICEYFFAASF